MQPAPQDLTLLEHEPPFDLLGGTQGLWWLLAAVLLVTAGSIILFLLIRRRRVTPAPANPPAAHAQALAALANCPEGDAHQAALTCSLILRRYLAMAVGEPSLYETHEEFVARHNALAPLSEDLRERVGHFLMQLAALKYDASATAHADGAGILEQSRQLLASLREEFER